LRYHSVNFLKQIKILHFSLYKDQVASTGNYTPRQYW
jgi:hypothetical protein